MSVTSNVSLRQQADHLSKINFNLELDSTNVTRQASSDDSSSDDEMNLSGSEKPPSSFPVDLDQGAGETNDMIMETCESAALTCGREKSPEDEWADFDNFAAQRVSHATDAPMEDSPAVDPSKLIQEGTSETIPQPQTPVSLDAPKLEQQSAD